MCVLICERRRRDDEKEKEKKAREEKTSRGNKAGQNKGTQNQGLVPERRLAREVGGVDHPRRKQPYPENRREQPLVKYSCSFFISLLLSIHPRSCCSDTHTKYPLSVSLINLSHRGGDLSPRQCFFTPYFLGHAMHCPWTTCERSMSVKD
jgi:hypothetical protein